MNELLDELNNLKGQIKALEDEAIKHEQAARDCRSRRQDLKLRLSEINAEINDAKVVHAAQSSMAAANAARKDVESSKAELDDLLASLRAAKSEFESLQKQSSEKDET